MNDWMRLAWDWRADGCQCYKVSQTFPLDYSNIKYITSVIEGN